MTQRIGMPVSDFALQALEQPSRAWSLQDCLEGKQGAVFVFWSALCAHCVRYDGFLNSFPSRHPDLSLFAIASRAGEAPSQMRAAMAARSLTFPILIDPGCKVAQAWNSQQTPRCYLIGADRTLIYRGAIDNFKTVEDDEFTAYLEPAIQSFLSGEPVARPETASFGCAIQTVYYQLPRQL